MKAAERKNHWLHCIMNTEHSETLLNFVANSQAILILRLPILNFRLY
jgi:hypothetical protein